MVTRLCRDLGLYRLLTPYFLLGRTWPDHVDEYLSELGVVDLSSTYDESATIYTGTLQFGPDAPVGTPVPEVRRASRGTTSGFASG